MGSVLVLASIRSYRYTHGQKIQASTRTGIAFVCHTGTLAHAHKIYFHVSIYMYIVDIYLVALYRQLTCIKSLSQIMIYFILFYFYLVFYPIYLELLLYFIIQFNIEELFIEIIVSININQLCALDWKVKKEQGWGHQAHSHRSLT